ncbi:hypothetical protein ACRRTK_016477 [Alexandromys fortis]
MKALQPLHSGFCLLFAPFGVIRVARTEKRTGIFSPTGVPTPSSPPLGCGSVPMLVFRSEEQK